MARMSIDDKIGRDTRITWLAAELGWSKRELVGCFVLDLWPLCYDRLTPTLPARDIDIAAGKPGFADKLVEAGLGTVTKHGIRVSGAAERIEYLLRAKSAGKKGGKASGKSRGSNGPSSPPRSNPPGAANPPDTVPDPDAASAPVPDADSPPDVAPAFVEAPVRTPSPPARSKSDRGSKLPEDWLPSRCEANVAAEQAATARGVDLKLELSKLRDWAKGGNEKKSDWEATWRNWTRNAKPTNGSGRRQPGDVFTYLENKIEQLEMKEKQGDRS